MPTPEDEFRQAALTGAIISGVLLAALCTVLAVLFSQ